MHDSNASDLKTVAKIEGSRIQWGGGPGWRRREDRHRTGHWQGGGGSLDDGRWTHSLYSCFLREIGNNIIS